LHGGGVRADGDGGASGREEGTQPRQDVDGAEVIDGGEQGALAVREAGQAGAGDDAVQVAVGALGGCGDRGGPAFGGAQVRDDVDVGPAADVDANDPPAFVAQTARRGGADARRGTGDDDGATGVRQRAAP
jgi:hypothetical protein